MPGEQRTIRQEVGGFTLVELLTVIGILAALAGLLLPALSRARAASRQAACLSNTRNWAQGMHLYANAYEDFNANDGGTVTIGGVKWPAINTDAAKLSHWLNVVPPALGYRPYWQWAESGKVPMPGSGRDGALFVCPSDPAREGQSDPLGYSLPYAYVYNGQSLAFYFSYIYNVKGSGANNTPPKLGRMAKPSKTVILLEKRSGISGDEYPDSETVLAENPNAQFDAATRASYAAGLLNLSRGHWPCVTARHSNRSAHIAYGDGHGAATSFALLQDTAANPANPGKPNHNTDNIVWSAMRDPITN